MAPLAYLAVGAIAAVLVIGLRARTGDLAFEDRGLCRARARWAAESAIARARSYLAAGFVPGALRGTLDDSAGYALEVSRDSGAVVLKATGTCAKKDDRNVRAVVTAKLEGAGTRWRITTWSETP
jgi:hypothetical protein